MNKTIYINLLEEGSAAARPVQAEELGNHIYRIMPTPEYGNGDEVWEFPPGSLVKCAEREYRGKTYLLAIEKA